MYKALSLDKKWVKGYKIEIKRNDKNWKEKAFIKTGDGKVEIYPNTITKAIGVDKFGDYLYVGDFVKISNKKESEVYSIEMLQFSTYIFYQKQKQLFTNSDLENIFGKNFSIIKVGNKIEGGEFYE